MINPHYSAVGSLPEAQELRAIYEGIAARASKCFDSLTVTTDPHLANRPRDRRVGLSVIARFTPEIASKVSIVMELLKTLEPDQYAYRPDELHLTVLSLITACDEFESYRSLIPRFQEVVANTVSQSQSFGILYEGLVPAPDSILIAGYPVDGQLAALRESLRTALRADDLGFSLDSRYRIKTAHCTIFRFVHPLRDLARFRETLEARKDEHFGLLRIGRLDLVINDWYMSKDRTHLISNYSLAPP